jgi:hypothetical protein
MQVLLAFYIEDFGPTVLLCSRRILFIAVESLKDASCRVVSGFTDHDDTSM